MVMVEDRVDDDSPSPTISNVAVPSSYSSVKGGLIIVWVALAISAVCLAVLGILSLLEMVT